MNRIVSAGQVIRDQVDVYSTAGRIARQQRLTVAAFTTKLFLDNVLQTWPLLDGSTVPDSSVSSGSVYINEISGNLGYYSVRFFPNKVGFWRLLVTVSGLNTEDILGFDVVAAGSFGGSSGSGGLNASFTG